MKSTINLKYKRAPLPFVGQKYRFLKPFAELIEKNIPDDGEGITVVDVFGGSGLLSRAVKDLKPKARVIYNDFINYSERLKHIDDTNKLRTAIYNFITESGYNFKNAKLSPEHKQQVLKIIDSFSGFKDDQTLYAWLTFSGGVSRGGKRDLFIIDCQETTMG